jgi:serine/threonine protein kinase
MSVAPSDETGQLAATRSGRSCINQFEIGDLIARGGMGSVYQGIDRTNHRRVAIKRLKPDLNGDGPDEAVLRFERESRILLSLDHPNIIKVVDAFVADDEYHIVMEYVAGGSLRERLELEPQLAHHEALRLTLELCAALSCVHGSGIVHRDIKPENVLLAQDGSPRLSDFGLSHSCDPRLTRSHALAGTIAYMSPEVLWGNPADERADIWALGVMLFEMLAGQRPFSAAHPGPLLTAILHQDPMNLEWHRPELPPALVHLVHHLLEKDPARRPADVRQVAATLSRIIDEAPLEGLRE